MATLMGNEPIWSGKAIRPKTKNRKWYSVYDKSVGLLGKVIIAASVIFAIYNFIVNGIKIQSIIIMVLVILIFIGVSVLVKLKFQNAKYVLTKHAIEIGSWSLFGGRKLTKIDIERITKTYLLEYGDDIGTILLYSDKLYLRPTDIVSGAELETIAIQYISSPKAVKNLIDELRMESGSNLRDTL